MSELDQLLQQRRDMGRTTDASVSDALMARIMADAAQEQLRAANFDQSNALRMPIAVAAKQFDLWGMIAALFGGRGVVAGLASVACAGIYLGAAQPTALMDLAAPFGGLAAVDQLDFMPSIDVLLAEE